VLEETKQEDKYRNIDNDESRRALPSMQFMMELKQRMQARQSQISNEEADNIVFKEFDQATGTFVTISRAERDQKDKLFAKAL